MKQSVDQLETELANVDQDVEHYQKDAEGKNALLTFLEKHDLARRRILAFLQQTAWAQVEEEERCIARSWTSILFNQRQEFKDRKAILRLLGWIQGYLA